MDTDIAQNLLLEAGRLVTLTATFQARYGKGYQLNPGSPEAAWTLHRQIFDTQRNVARLLDESAVKNPRPRYGQWWEQYDVMEMVLAQEIVSQVSHLIGACAYAEVDLQSSSQELSRMSGSIQRAIAGMLHPNSLRAASESRPKDTATGEKVISA